MPSIGSKRIPDQVKICPSCNREFGTRGFGRHLQSCTKHLPVPKDDLNADTSSKTPSRPEELSQGGVPIGGVALQLSSPSTLPGPSRHSFDPFAAFDNRVPTPASSTRRTPVAPNNPDEWGLELNDPLTTDMSHNSPQSSHRSQQHRPVDNAEHQLGRPPQIDDIMVEPHPKNASGRKTQYYEYASYPTDQPSDGSSPPLAKSAHAGSQAQFNAAPWAPFLHKLDFDLAEFMQETHLSRSQVDRLLTIISNIVKSPEDYSLVDGRQVSELWEAATTMHGHGVRSVFRFLEEVTLAVPYKEDTISVPVWRVNAWDWCMELLTDPILSRELRFDSERLFRHNETEFERVINEPWTANTWWNIQSCLPENGVPFCLVLYADKTKLSSMGTKKGYPVYIRCANLPSNIRNGEELGGGRLVGWLPILPEDANEAGKKAYVDFKRVVWHAAFSEILKSLEEWAKTGYLFECSDGIERLLFPIILILSADFEEQCVMAAVRGMGSNFPCPICLIPIDKFPGLIQKHPLRTTENMRKAYNEAALENATESEEILKALGLRNVENSLWKLQYTDVYRALSWDRLHAYHSGLFRKHILKELLEILKDGGRAMTATVERQLQDMPRWRDLSHFIELAPIQEFSDGRKYEDLSKVIIFATHNLFSPNEARGYQWLALARSYLELDMWSSLRDHTATTLKLGRAELQRFESEREKYAAIWPDKAWDFPKAHSHSHMFDDIENKGSTVHFTTKMNEKMHKGPKTIYDYSNFKNIEPQIARITHEQLAAMVIRRSVDLDQQRKEYEAAQEADEVTPSVPTKETIPDTLIDDGRIQVGSPLGSQILVADLGKHVSAEFVQAFTGIRSKLNKRLLQDWNKRGVVSADTKVTMYQYLKVDYVSVEDSKIATDYLRFNPDFHDHERYDCALIRVNDNSFVIARLLTVLGVSQSPGSKQSMYAVVIPFDVPIPQRELASRENRNRASHLRFKQIRSRLQKDSTIVPVECIERGALVVRDYGSMYPDQYVVVDVVDADFFLRMRLRNLGDHLVTQSGI